MLSSLVDMDLEGGDAGGEVVAQARPSRSPGTRRATGQYLKPVLARKAKGGRRAAERSAIRLGGPGHSGYITGHLQEV